MGGVHSSSFRNVVRAESAAGGAGGRSGTSGVAVGLLAFPSVTQWTPVRTELLPPTGSTPDTRNSEGLLIIFSLGLLNIMTFPFSRLLC